MRNFEKISFAQFRKDIKDEKKLYENYNIPIRKTKKSAGYDFESLIDFTLKPGEIKKIPLGIKAEMNEGEVLLLFVRSSMGFKYNIRLTNQVGIIDSDYYNNIENEGHIFICLQNEGDKEYVVHKKDAICQGVFINFLMIDNEEEIQNSRDGGFGSTNKGESKNE